MAVIALMDVVDGGRLWKFMGRGVLIYVKKRGGGENLLKFIVY